MPRPISKETDFQEVCMGGEGLSQPSMRSNKAIRECRGGGGKPRSTRRLTAMVTTAKQYRSLRTNLPRAGASPVPAGFCTYGVWCQHAGFGAWALRQAVKGLTCVGPYGHLALPEADFLVRASVVGSACVIALMTP